MPVKITISNNGPIRIQGTVEVFDANGNAFDLGGRETFSLCRCGQSAKTPFCDGAHSKCGFDSSVEAYALPPKK